MSFNVSIIQVCLQLNEIDIIIKMNTDEPDRETCLSLFGKLQHDTTGISIIYL